MEKLFYVAKLYKYCTPSIVFSTPIKEDATAMAEILGRKDGDESYIVLETVEKQ